MNDERRPPILSTHPAARRWLRRIAWFAAGVAALWLLLWLAVPPLARWQGEKQLSRLLGRDVQIGAVQFRPWSLKLGIDRFRIGASPGASGTEPLLSIERLSADFAAASIARRAPVVRSLVVESPRVVLARTADGRSDIDDVLARLAPAPDAPPGEPARFAVYNVELRDGAVTLHDARVGRTHVIDGIALGVPFLSNLPADLEVKVEPRLAFRVNGVAFDTGASATPFAKDRAADLRLDVQGLDVGPYLGYLPESLPVRPRQGRLSAALRVRFALDAGGAASVAIDGRGAADDVALADASGTPLAAWKHLGVELADVRPLERALEFGTIRLDGATLHLRRDETGSLVWPAPGAGAAAPAAAAMAASRASSVGVAATPASGAGSAAVAAARAPSAGSATAAAASSAASAAATPSAVAAPWRVRAARLEVADATLRWNDASTRPAAALRLSALGLQVEAPRWPVEAPIAFRVDGRLGVGDAEANAGTLRAEGNATDREAQAAVAIEGLALDAFAPYVAQWLAPPLVGQAAAKLRLEWAAEGAKPGLRIAVDEGSLDALRLGEARGRGAAPATLRGLAIADARIDLAASSVEVGSLRVVQPALDLARDRAGRWSFEQWLSARRVAEPPGAATTPETPAAPAWTIGVRQFAIEGGRAHLRDAAVPAPGGDGPIELDLADLRLAVQDFAWPSTAGTKPARAQLALRLGSGRRPAGSFAWTGQFVPDPLFVRGQLRARELALPLAEPYVRQALTEPPPLALLRAEAGFDGTFEVRLTRAGLRLRAGGDAQLADLLLHARDAAGAVGDELLGWQSLALKGIAVEAEPGAKPRVEIGEVTLADFHSRLVVTEQGRFNLRDVAAPAPGAAASAPAAAASEVAGTPTVAGAARDAASASAAAAPPASPASAALGTPGADLPIVLAVGGVQLSGGRIDFTDRFIRPNYSARLTELAGRLGAFRSDSREMATLDLRGRAEGTAQLEIVGSLNPTADPLALDIRAKATDLELAPLSPYAGKYAGYAIERGKLSMDVSYRIEPDGKLDARNQLVLNQLTFGEKVESPDATKLPVLLAVALLKDRNGVIDLDLPVSGSLNDPQFSVFGIVVKIIGNLLAKALTAPFALLAGAGGGDLSFVEFVPGTPQIAAGGLAVVDKVAKALLDRPALKLTVTGAADPAAERDASRRATLDARIAAERRRELARAGEPLPEGAPSLTAEDRARLVRAIYRATDLPDKPRNALGIARDIPVPEMEALLRAHLPVTDDQMRELALGRGIAVRDALVAKGLPSERLFVAAPKVRAGDDTPAGGAPRVQLELSTR